MTPEIIIAAYLVATMSAWQAPTTVPFPAALVQKHPDVVETPEQMQSRYESIAKDLISVVYAPSYVPFSSGKDARGKDATFALGVASFESGGFRSDVDRGYTFGVNGQDVCLMQVWMPFYLPAFGVTKEGWNIQDVAKDRVKCFITGTDRMRASWKACAGHHLLDRLAIYTVGHCKSNETMSRTRAGRAANWLAAHPVPVTDQEVLDKQFQNE